MNEEGEGGLCVDTDSDEGEQRDSGKVKVKWTPEEVSFNSHSWTCLNT